jgi:hypothetical protein
MRNHYISVLALALGSLFIVGCPSNNDANTDANKDVIPVGGDVGGDDRPPQMDLMPLASDGGLACCPTGFDLYDCQEPGGGAGLACHNPALGCASSLTCGQGCDPRASGRCPCVQTNACIVGYHFDPALCQCVAKQDAGMVPPVDAKPTCIDNVLCIQGDHFDTTLCGCVPDTSPGSCNSATDCTGALPALCQLCPDGGNGCAHFTCVASQCQVAYCP